MALTTILDTSLHENSGTRFQTYGTGNLGSYVTGGVAFVPNQFGLGEVMRLVIDPSSGYTFQSLLPTRRIQAFRETNDGTGARAESEVDNGVDLSGVTFTWRAEGF